MDTIFAHIVLTFYNRSPHTTKDIDPIQETFEMGYACVALAPIYEYRGKHVG